MIKWINQSTKEERQKIIDEMFQCHHGDCDNCGICVVFKGTSPQIVYQDYIDGIREFNDITQEMNRKRKDERK